MKRKERSCGKYFPQYRTNMKQGKKLTRSNKELVSAVGLNPAEWMTFSEDNTYLHIVKKENLKKAIICKETKKIIKMLD